MISETVHNNFRIKFEGALSKMKPGDRFINVPFSREQLEEIIKQMDDEE